MGEEEHCHGVESVKAKHHLAQNTEKQGMKKYLNGNCLLGYVSLGYILQAGYYNKIHKSTLFVMSSNTQNFLNKEEKVQRNFVTLPRSHISSCQSSFNKVVLHLPV